MATKEKTKSVKIPNSYAYVIYGGALKSGSCGVVVTSDHPESKTEFEAFKHSHGKDVKGRYVKCAKPIDTIKTEIFAKLNANEDCNLSADGPLLYKL